MIAELNIHKADMTLDDGQTIHFMYDIDSDDLEIVFEKGRANCTIELTDDIVLRFDKEEGKALSLILISFSTLTQPTEMGPKSFPLTGLADLPKDLRQTVVEIITSPPANRFLKVSYFYPSPTKCISITYLESPPALAAIAR